MCRRGPTSPPASWGPAGQPEPRPGGAAEGRVMPPGGTGPALPSHHLLSTHSPFPLKQLFDLMSPDLPVKEAVRRFWSSQGRWAWQPTPVLLPGESHGHRSLVGYIRGVAKSRTRRSDSSVTGSPGSEQVRRPPGTPPGEGLRLGKAWGAGVGVGTLSPSQCTSSQKLGRGNTPRSAGVRPWAAPLPPPSSFHQRYFFLIGA